MCKPYQKPLFFTCYTLPHPGFPSSAISPIDQQIDVVWRINATCNAPPSSAIHFSQFMKASCIVVARIHSVRKVSILEAYCQHSAIRNTRHYDCTILDERVSKPYEHYTHRVAWWPIALHIFAQKTSLLFTHLRPYWGDEIILEGPLQLLRVGLNFWESWRRSRVVREQHVETPELWPVDPGYLLYLGDSTTHL